MALRVPFRMLRRTDPAPAAAVLLQCGDPAALLAACARLTDPLIFPIRGGYLVVADCSAAAVPQAVRLRRLSENAFLPVDADLSPSLLPAEVIDLTSRRGLVFLPGCPPLAFDAARPLRPAEFLGVPKPRRNDWAPLPAGRSLAEHLTGITRILPQTPDDMLQGDGPPVGTDEIRPPDVGPGRRALGRASAGLGKGLKGLGKALGSEKLAKIGGTLTGLAAALAPRLTEELLGKQEAALQQLLKRFRAGKTDDALRHAVPIGGDPGRGSRPYTSARLPTNSLFWSLASLFGGGASSIWAGGHPDTWRDLISEYRRAAEAAADRGDFRRAALIYARLLGDYRAAAEVLARGGLHRQAAILFRDKVRQMDRAAAEFAKAGEHDEAVRLYREAHLHLDAGDLLRRLGEEDQAVAEYHRAAERVIELRTDYVEAGDILLKKTGRADLAGAYFALGWRDRKASLANARAALPSAERLVEIYAFAEPRDPFWELLTEAEDWLREPGWAHDAGRFLNKVAGLADLPHLAADRPEIRDRCRMGLAAKLREQSTAETGAGTAVADLFGRSNRWSPGVVSDADFAARATRKHRPRVEQRTAVSATRLVHLWTGTVTAAIQAADTGDVFLGFQNGAVVHFDPVTGVSRVLYPDTGFPVLGLATDRAGDYLVALRADTSAPPTDWLKAYALEFAERRRTGHVPRSRTVWLQEPETLLGLLPLINNPEWDPVAAVSTAHGIGSYSLPGLIARAEAGVQSPLPPTTHLWLWVIERQGGISRVTFHGGSVSWGGGRSYIGWMPDPAPGSSLFTPPVAWLVNSHASIELAGLFDNATLYWTELTRHERGLSARTLAHAAPGGFRAVAIWRPGEVIGVSATNCIVWLKARGNKFEVSGRPVDLATPARAVACFVGRESGEALVVLEDGHLARVPVPA